MSDGIEIGSDRLTARIDPLGAELVSLHDRDGRELMTDADPAFWTGHAPILFPIVGRLAGDTYRLGDRRYALPQHGFARRRAFDIVDRSADRVRCTLRDDAETHAAYPFAFVLHVEHSVVGATLSTRLTIENVGNAEMPCSIGFHPAFAWPLPYGQRRGDHRIVFAGDEPGELRSIAADGTIAAAPRPSPLDGRTLPLADDLFADDALVWDPVHSRSVRYGAITGPQLRVDFAGCDKLGIWTKPGARFVCIEPWDGIADPEGYSGDFRDKPGIRRLAAGTSHSVAMTVTLEG